MKFFNTRYSPNFYISLSMLAYFLFLSNLSFSQCPTPPGNQTTSGAGSWIGYVYSYTGAQAPPANNPFVGTYRGFVTESENFDRDHVNAGYPITSNLCTALTDAFAVRYKMTKTYAAGDYQITTGGDDGYRLYINGTLQSSLSNWADHSYSTTTALITLTGGSTDLIFEYFENTGQAHASFNILGVCTSTTTAPTSITGTTTICAGQSTTLTATGGNSDVGSFFEWGTGTVGSNVIAGQPNSTITVSPTSTQTYWVRRVDAGRCKVTAGVTQQVTVNPTATAPTGISGNAVCVIATSITLTATGGTGNVFQWGTGGTVGSNIIGGQSNATLLINSPVNGTQYWVRRLNQSPCTGSTTAGVITTLSFSSPSGDQTSYGNNSWIGYVYVNQSTFPPANGFNTNYAGYVAQPFTFDQNIGSGSISGPNLCNTYNESFAIRYKMTRTMPSATYSVTVGGDDGFRLSVDGGLTWITDNARWANQGYTTQTLSVSLSGVVNFVLEYFENGGDSRVSFNICSTAPTGISGTNPVCTGSSTTLTATGGVAATDVSYRWGTGSTVGSNIIAGQTSVSITVSPTVNTTYWVQRMSLGTCSTTTGVTQLVTVSPTTVAGTITGAQTVCKDAAPINNITLSGNTGGVVRWEKSTDSAFISPAPTTIANTTTTLTGAEVGNVSSPTYIRAVVKSGACLEVNTNAVLLGFESTTWNMGAWTNGPPTLTKSVIINSNYNTTTNSNLDACSVIINPGVTLTVTSNNYLLIQNNLQIDGTINIQNTGSLVQISNNAVNTGNINMVRTTSQYEKFDYVYWSSPVVSTTMANPFNGWRMDYAFLFNTANFSDRFSGPYPQTTGSPDSFDDNGDDYQPVTANTVMIPGKGYIVMTPTTGTFPTTANVTFSGVPNNGTITIPLALSANNADNNDDFNLVGNPYPSAISATNFINTNLPNISGTLYIWTHVGNISPSNPGPNSNNYNSDDYALFNLSGGTRTALTAGANVVPNGFIGAGQSFLVDAENTNNLIFNNAMRSKNHSNTQFFRNNIQTQNTTDERDRIWLNLYNQDQMFSQQLINYTENATLGYDMAYDGIVSPTQNFVSFYSLIPNDTNLYRIQAKPTWNENDTVPLGYFSAVSGNVTIAIDEKEGVFNNPNTAIFLQDNLLNITHNLYISS